MCHIYFKICGTKDLLLNQMSLAFLNRLIWDHNDLNENYLFLNCIIDLAMDMNLWEEKRITSWNNNKNLYPL